MRNLQEGEPQVLRPLLITSNIIKCYGEYAFLPACTCPLLQLVYPVDSRENPSSHCLSPAEIIVLVVTLRTVTNNSMENNMATPKDYVAGGTQKKVKSANDSLPSRNAKWWYPTVNNTTVMVGAGVLGLPYTMAFLGWGPGLLLHVLSWTITLYTLWQLVEMHEMVPGKTL